MSTIVNNLVRISHVPGCTPGAWGACRVATYTVSLRGTVLCTCPDQAEALKIARAVSRALKT